MIHSDNLEKIEFDSKQIGLYVTFMVTDLVEKKATVCAMLPDQARKFLSGALSEIGLPPVYPEIEWINQGELDGDDKRWKGAAEGFEFDIRYQWGGKGKEDWQGHWTCIVNHGAIQTGHGPHGYLYDSAEEAMQAAETEMKRRIDERVKSALTTLMKYTVMEPQEVTNDD